MSTLKQAGQDAIDQLESLLQDLRPLSSLVEKKREVFSRKSKAFLHFHEDPSATASRPRRSAPRSSISFERNCTPNRQGCNPPAEVMAVVSPAKEKGP
jgi:hypothetical protein